jgi:hypothetical protein
VTGRPKPRARVLLRSRWGALAVAILIAALALAATEAAQANAGGPVYSRVPLQRLLRSHTVSFAVGTTDFLWTLVAHPGIIDGRPTRSQTLLDVRRDHCRSIHLYFAAGHHSAFLALSQRGRATTTSIISDGYIGTLDMSLTPGRPFKLFGATIATGAFIYVNGWATCTIRPGQWRQPYLRPQGTD